MTLSRDEDNAVQEHREDEEARVAAFKEKLCQRNPLFAECNRDEVADILAACELLRSWKLQPATYAELMWS